MEGIDPTTEHGSLKIGLITGAIFLLLVGGIVGYILGSGGAKPVMQETITPSSSISVTPAISTDASGQKVYSNSTYKYQFIFPADWKFAEYDGNVVAVDSKAVLSAEAYSTLDLPAGGFVVRPATHFSYVIGYESFPTIKIGIDNISVKYFKEVTGSNTDNPAGKNRTGYVYYVPFSGSQDEGVVISISYPNGDPNASAYTKILSSFKFTN